ncbi:MAG: hypothetical protein IKU58_06750 [Clostridia bacterium]|nr:hypothetical protein [Clostridia bacterium]
MSKFFFTIITEPLGLPLDWWWEYLILAIIGKIAFEVAWDASPGGLFGSEIHWSVRTFAFIILWAVTYVVIAVVKWLVNNWVLVAVIIGTVLVILCGIMLVKKQRKAVKARAVEKESGENE